MVVVGKKVERRRLVDGLLGLIPEAIIAWIVAAYTQAGALGFVAVFFGLLGLYLLIWIKNSLWMWLMYWVAGRRQLTASLEGYLVTNRFPPPPEYVHDIDDYLGRVANGEQYDCPTRVKAAIEIGTFAGLALAGRIQSSLKVKIAYESALERYAKRFPPPPRREDDE
jgi:hypothetical protein